MNPSVRSEREDFPVLSTRQLVLFPAMRCWVYLANTRALHAVEAALDGGDSLVALFAARTQSTCEPEPDQLYSIGTIGQVMRASHRSCCGGWMIDLEGVARVRMERWLRRDPFRQASCVRLPESIAEASAAAVASAVRALARRIHDACPACGHAQHAVDRLAECGSPAEVTGAVGALLTHLAVEQRQRVLEIDSLDTRLQATLAALHARLLRLNPNAHGELLQ